MKNNNKNLNAGKQSKTSDSARAAGTLPENKTPGASAVRTAYDRAQPQQSSVPAAKVAEVKTENKGRGAKASHKGAARKGAK